MIFSIFTLLSITTNSRAFASPQGETVYLIAMIPISPLSPTPGKINLYYTMTQYFSPFHGQMFHILFIHSLALAFMNKATINIHVPVFMWAHVFNILGYIGRCGIVGSYDNHSQCLTLEGAAKLFSKSAVPFYHARNNV